MDKKNEFKEFVKNNPSLISFVRSGEKTWQNFFELYDMYGDDKQIWDSYINTNKHTTKKASSLNDLMVWLKGIDLDSFQEGVQNIQRVIALLGDITSKEIDSNNYRPRPLYKHFDD